MRSVIISAATAIILLFAVACSNSSAPTSPGLSEIRATGGSQQVWGVYDLSWDGVSDEMTVVLNRNLEQHYNITPWLFPNNIKLQILDWNTTTKVLTVAAQIQNPFALDGYDVRGILFNLGEIRLLNPDDYTKIFDPNDPKVANPFRAYAKGEENRKFYGVNSPPEDHTKTEVYEIYFPAGFNVSYMVTASYPGNAEEPYDIVSIETTGKIETDGGSIDVTIQVLDWQDVTAESVTLLSNPVTGTDVPMTPDGGDPTFWHATIMNDGGAPIGTYEIWVEANDDTSPDSLYNKFDIDITEAINDPPVIESGVDGNQIPQDDAVELYTVTASDDGGILTYHW
ncbi:MAG TPA: hypothetical protein VGB30_07410, partial [bacterium]